MKTVYVPKGETVSFHDLATDHIVVKGHLSISGPGSVSAGQICVNRISVGDLTSGHVLCDELEANQVETLEVFASQYIAVSGKLTAGRVKTKWLAMTRSSIEDVEAGEIICLPAKPRGMSRFLLASSLRVWWTRFTAPESEPVDADYEPAEGNGSTVVQFGAKDENQPAA